MVQMVMRRMDMAGMQRFVTYIYAYEDGRKMNNTGYAKLETRGERGQVEIHFVNGGIYRGKGKVAFLCAGKGKLIYVPIGEFVIENGTGNGLISFRTDSLAEPDLSFSKLDGIYIVDSEGGRYLSFWRDTDVTDFSEENFEEYGKDMLVAKAVDHLSSESVEESDPVQEEQDAAIQKEQMLDAEQESLHTMEIPMRNVFPSYTMEDIWNNFTKTKNPVQINDGVSAVRMELNDLRELPKQYWYLGNNSFLLHGFFNYRYLLFGRLPGGKWFIGVPGIYAGQEKVMASVFGFPGFMSIDMPEKEMNMPLETITPREKQQGVWYHILED